MGGKALTEVITHRMDRGEYHEKIRRVYDLLHLLCDGGTIYGIPQVLVDKESFGDIDCVVYARGDITNRIREAFQPRQIVRNGNTYSFDFEGVQIDVTSYPSVYEPPFAEQYMSYSDLGGMMGQLWSPFGFILRDTGLFYRLRDAESPTRVIEDVLVTDNWSSVCSLMGLDGYSHYRRLSDEKSAFEWLASSHMFDPNIFLPEGMNRDQRKRKESRPMYQNFLKWIGEKYPEATGIKPEITPRDHQIFLRRVCKELPDFESRLNEVVDANKNDQDWRRAFNGTMAAQKTGYDGKELGRFMEFVNKKVTGSDRAKVAKFNKADYDLWFSLIWNQYKDFYELG